MTAIWTGLVSKILSSLLLKLKCTGYSYLFELSWLMNKSLTFLHGQPELRPLTIWSLITRVFIMVSVNKVFFFSFTHHNIKETKKEGYFSSALAAFHVTVEHGWTCMVNWAPSSNSCRRSGTSWAVISASLPPHTTTPLLPPQQRRELPCVRAAQRGTSPPEARTSVEAEPAHTN